MKISGWKWAMLTMVVLVMTSCQTTNNDQFSKRYQYKLNHGRELSTKTSDQRTVEHQNSAAAVVKAQRDKREEVQQTAEYSDEIAVRPTVPVSGGNKTHAPKAKVVRSVEAVTAVKTRLSRQNQAVKAFRKSLREAVRPETEAYSDSEILMLVVLFLLAFILPPLAVFLKDDGVTNRFWVNLILWILGWGAGAGVGGIAWLLAMLAVVHAILVVAEMI